MISSSIQITRSSYNVSLHHHNLIDPFIIINYRAVCDSLMTQFTMYITPLLFRQKFALFLNVFFILLADCENHGNFEPIFLFYFAQLMFLLFFCLLSGWLTKAELVHERYIMNVFCVCNKMNSWLGQYHIISLHSIYMNMWCVCNQ